ncbi:aspartate kinase [Vibrio sp.]|nr:aspartate kinase [Vibrio sp.]
MTPSQQLHKFGGSSLADPSCFLRVAKLIQHYAQQGDFAVVSAAGKTTNRLITFTDLLANNQEGALHALYELKTFQTSLIHELLEGTKKDALLSQLNDEVNALTELEPPLSSATLASVLGHGEMWSARLLAALLCQQHFTAKDFDSRLFLRAEQTTQPKVKWATSKQLADVTFQSSSQQFNVVTGFMAQNQEGDTVLLGRNGSDYSATITGALAGVDTVTIWSDVAGVYSADPRHIDDAQLQATLGLDETSELARLAAPVLHSRTLQPMEHHSMHVVLRSSYAPESGSTEIVCDNATPAGVKIVNSVNDIVCFSLESTSKEADELLLYLKEKSLEPLLAQYEHQQLTLAYTKETSEEAYHVLDDVITADTLKQHNDQALISLVGRNIHHHNAQFTAIFPQHSIKLCSQNSDGLSLSVILDIEQSDKVNELVEALHQRFITA